MGQKIRLAMLGLAAGGLAFVTGCRETTPAQEPGVGGSGYEAPVQTAPAEDNANIGEREGVLNDGEGAFEDNQGVLQGDSQLGDGKIGEQEGVINDGEGPLENTEQMMEEDNEPAPAPVPAE